MKCPACGEALVQFSAGDVEVDGCQNGCGGIWFDRDELFKFDEPSEFDHSPILSLMAACSAPPSMPNPKHCPRCENEPLVRQTLDHENKIQMDQCWNCGGVWLDAGELLTLRSEFKTYADRQQAADDLIDNALKSYEEGVKERTQKTLAAYNEQHRNRFRSALSAVRSLLLGEDDEMDV